LRFSNKLLPLGTKQSEMNRTVLEEQIGQTIEKARSVDSVGEYVNKTNLVQALTDLFIELSNERCKEQKVICCDNFHWGSVDENSILNAPLPELD